jgi:hypothetical protein
MKKEIAAAMVESNDREPDRGVGREGKAVTDLENRRRLAVQSGAAARRSGAWTHRPR